MPKLFSLSVVMLLCPFLLFSQEYTLTLEEYATDIVPGLTTYRMYIDMVNTDDFLSSIYGGEEAPLLISTSNNSFFNSGFGGSTASAINPAFLPFFPELAADSWVTIGIDQQETGDEVAISTLEDADQPWVECFAAGSALDGQNVAVDSEEGGAWYVLNGTPNGLPDENMRVLFLQMTTAGEICGTINAQVFQNVTGFANLLFTYEFCGTGTYSPAVAGGGCTDELACNYDAEATEDDGSCVYADTYYDCDGNCLSDADSDGICDELEVADCTDSFACNYNMEATDDDGTCDYLSCAGCTDDEACNYDPIAIYENGQCDYSCLGCTDETACNYDADATVDDGSCTYVETYYDCDGTCLNDFDLDGVCNELEIPGCTDAAALNFDANATDQDGSCAYPAVCNDETACNYTPYEAYCIQIEAYAEHDGMVGMTDLSGYTTYRIYALCENEDDFVSAVAGDDEFASYIHTTTSFFQHEAGGVLGESSNPLVFPFIPEAAYDSWVTIGLDEAASSANGESGVSILEGLEPWVEPFEAGGSLNIADALGGVWYILNGATNGVAGEDKKVLLGQFTTDGNLDGQLYVQFFENGDDINGDFMKLIGLNDACGLPTYDSCEYAEELYDCEGDCLADSDADGVCDALEVNGCTDVTANNYDPLATDDDGTCDYSSNQGCTNPWACNYDPDMLQDDGSCEFTSCVGCTDDTACNYDPNAIYEDGTCDYSCNVGCTNPVACNYDPDVDEDDGSCDYTSCVGCTDEGACNYDPIFTVDNGSCDYSCLGCTDETACNYDADATGDDGSCTYVETYYDCAGNCLNDFDGDGVCNELEVPGCTFEVACNFNPMATEDDGSCYFYCPGCTDEAACNYDAGAIQEDGSCEYPVDWYGVDYVDCNNECINDNDGDGVCDEDEIPGCTDPTACNFFEEATDQLIPCEYPDEGYDCEGSCLNDSDEDGLCDPFDACPLDAENDADGDGVCGNDEVEGCTNDAACNYDPMATDDDGTCETIEMLCGASYFNCDCTCQSDADWDGVCDEAEVPGCQEPSACNFNEEATDSDGSCEWSSCAGCIYVYACNYDPSAIYSDGSCEFGTCPGCTDPTACNFNPTVSEDDGSCTVNDACGECGGSGPVEGYNCDGSCIDSDQDGVCDFDEAGCTDATACNFAPLAQEDDGSCTYPETCFDCTSACLDENANGICDCDEVHGCTDAEACNFQPAANVDDGSCAPWVYVTGGCYSECPTCLGELINDADGDGVCDSAEVGSCMDATACNYDECATDDDGSCLYPENGYDCEGNCMADVDGDCVCDPEEIYGCTYAGACNFNPAATEEDGSCIVAETFYDCDGNCLEDFDDDGVCDGLEVLGCNDPTACNFQPSATEDDDSCWYPANDNLGCDGLCINDADGDGVCDEVEVAGCKDCTACNYNSDATDEDGSCVYPEEGLDCEGNCLLDADGNGTCDDAELALLISFLNSGELCGPGTFWDQATGQCTTADNCPMDFDGNGDIGAGDLLLFLAQYASVCDEDPMVDCAPGVFDSNIDGNVFVVCPDVQFVTVILTGASGGSGGNVCGQTVGASTCNLCDATGGNGGLSTAIEFTINNLSAGDELALVPGILGADSDEVITCTPGFEGWPNWDCGPASDGENGGTTHLLLNGEVIAEISGGSGGTGACIGCQGDGCFNGNSGQNGEVTLIAPWIFYAEETQLVGAQEGQLVIYY